jgi:alpha-beta hydrolase superfamily lysophospholipase
MNLKKAWRIFKITILAYVALGVILYFTQSWFIFHPKKLPADHRFDFTTPFREVNIPVTTGKNISIVQFVLPDSVRKGVVLYFHGNRENINRYAKYATLFTRNKYEVWMIDYPGYGKSRGKRSEKILYEDAQNFYKLANSKFPAEQIIIYGKSLGTGIASQLAMVRDCRRLILETPYYSMDAMGRHYFFIYPVMPLSKYSIPTHEYFEFITEPVTMFHGTRDQVIPYKHSKWLLKKNNGARLITIEKGRHNNLPEFSLFNQSLDSLLRL